MTANSTFIADVVAGQAEGERFVREVSEFSSQDELAIKVLKIVATDSLGNPKLRGFARALQKRLERLSGT